MAKKMSFEGLIYYGTAGSTASTQLTNIRDVSITVDKTTGNTTVRGSGSAVPIHTERATEINWSCEFTMLEDTTDTSLAAMKAAAVAGTVIALRLKDHSSGSGFDGDVTLSQRKGEPHGGEQTHTFTAMPNDDNRTPSLYT